MVQCANINCRKEFIFTTNKKYCSEKCRLTLKKQLHDKWMNNHPNYRKIKYLENKEKELKQQQERFKNNPEKYKDINKKSHKKRRLKMKQEIFTLLGSHCSNPYNIDHLAFELDMDYKNVLEIDHINGGGNKERKKLGLYNMYKRVFRYPNEYQLLCPTCNKLKLLKNNERNMIK